MTPSERKSWLAGLPDIVCVSISVVITTVTSEEMKTTVKNFAIRPRVANCVLSKLDKEDGK